MSFDFTAESTSVDWLYSNKKSIISATMRWWLSSLNLQVLKLLVTHRILMSHQNGLFLNYRYARKYQTVYQTLLRHYKNTNQNIWVNGTKDCASAAIQAVNVVGAASYAVSGQWQSVEMRRRLVFQTLIRGLGCSHSASGYVFVQAVSQELFLELK